MTQKSSNMIIYRIERQKSAASEFHVVPIKSNYFSLSDLIFTLPSISSKFDFSLSIFSILNKDITHVRPGLSPPSGDSFQIEIKIFRKKSCSQREPEWPQKWIISEMETGFHCIEIIFRETKQPLTRTTIVVRNAWILTLIFS